jgi:predicted amidohydrolase YtcJ
MRELNHFGLPGVIDAGEDSNSTPRTTPSLRPCKSQGLLTLRFAYNLFTQKPQEELHDFRRWTTMTRPGAGDAYYRANGA